MPVRRPEERSCFLSTQEVTCMLGNLLPAVTALLGAAKRGPRPKATVRRLRPRLEALEDRFMLAHDLLWIGNANGAWNVAANWVDKSDGMNYAPAMADNFTFQPGLVVNGQTGTDT